MSLKNLVNQAVQIWNYPYLFTSWIENHQKEFCIILMSFLLLLHQWLIEVYFKLKEYAAMLNYVNKHILSLLTQMLFHYN